jgi:HD superfamily phosphodiesterase
VNPFEIIHRHYDPASELYRVLVTHSVLVARKAREIACAYEERLETGERGAVDHEFLLEAAMLHDIGIGRCRAPEILCAGSEPYVRHGVAGREILEAEGLPRHALVCERHTGAGITAEEVRAGRLPLPERDYLPLSLEERIICVADKFYSKTPVKLWKEKSLAKIEKSLSEHGPAPLERWRALCRELLDGGRAAIALVLGLALAFIATSPAPAAAAEVDFSEYSRDAGVIIEHDAGRLSCAWPDGGGGFSRLVLDLRPGEPPIAALGVSAEAAGAFSPLLEGAEPVTFVTVGSRQGTAGRPPRFTDFEEFFDNPAKRPHETHRARLELRAARAAARGRRGSVTLRELEAGPFRGALRFTFYAGSPLLHVEAVVRTEEDRRALIYDAGLAGGKGWRRIVWRSTEDRVEEAPALPATAGRAVAVRYRALAAGLGGAEDERGSIACFPPPHQFQFPRDWTDNLGFTWFGSDHRGVEGPFGFGVRQAETGGGNFVPWFNAEPGKDHRLGVFYLLGRQGAEEALRAVERYTRSDRFPRLPGHLTFTSHYHMAMAVAAMEKKKSGVSPLPVPEVVSVFKRMGVDMVHLGEFHGDGHQQGPASERLPEVEAMFEECRRLSDGELLLIPGEEVNTFLGLKEPGKHPGHWMSLFPKPVYWVLQRGEGEPFVEEHPRYGRVYRVGGRDDMVRLLEAERGLAWTAHPRIKASSWTPDIFRREDFYLADFWLGAAWKALPGDLSAPRLGERPLALLDDMAGWGEEKYLVGEVDVFKIDHTHELYGHMNINYLRMERLPRFDDGWQEVLDALRGGRFWVTTGEVLIREFTVGGKESGETLAVTGGETPVRIALEWTFPLRFAELVSGSGAEARRERIELDDTEAFGSRVLELAPDLRGRRWARFEVWDVAANGAFTQPVWLR